MLAMPTDPIAELRSTISEQLRRFWRADPSEELQEDPAIELPRVPQAPALDSPRSGIAYPAPANRLREDVAAEIASRLRQERRSFGELLRQNHEESTGEAALSSTTASSLPLGARFKPRGIFEDDWAARPTQERPWPVILIHGTCDTKGIWEILGVQLRADGWAVFAPDYGNRGTQSIPSSSQQLGAYIEAVLEVTGAEQAILIGHSQGGLLARYWMRIDGGADRVRHLICISSPNHGTTQGGIASRLVRGPRQESVMRSIIDSWFGPVGMEQIVGSEILLTVNRDGDLEPGVSYTCIATRSDAVVVPPETCFLDPRHAPEGTVRNIYVQDFDRRAVVLHEDMPMDKRVHAIVRTLLEQIT